MSTTKITLKQIRTLAGAERFAEGEALYQDEAVSQTTREGDIYRAMLGTPSPVTLEVRLTESGHVTAICTCQQPNGTCEHVVALLLTILYEPERFVEIPTAADLLTRSKEQLVAIIQTMLSRHPDLYDTLTSKPSTAHLLDLSRHEQTIQKVFGDAKRGYRDFDDDYDDYDDDYYGDGYGYVLTPIFSILKEAANLGDEGQWANAYALYRSVADACVKIDEEDSIYEDEGLDDILTQVIDGLAACAKAFEDNDSARLEVLKTLLAFELWDLQQSGFGLAVDAKSALMQHATANDAALLRDHLKTTLKRPNNRGWQHDGYDALVDDLDALASDDDDLILERLKRMGQYSLVTKRLLDADRVDEAAHIMREHLTYSYQPYVTENLTRLVEMGHPNLAIEIAESVMPRIRGREEFVRQWLYQRYEADQNYERLTAMRFIDFEQYPSAETYQAIKRSAEQLGTWDRLRPTLIAQLEDKKRYNVLTLIFLGDEDWEKAWQAATQHPKGDWYYYSDQPQLQVANATRHLYPERAIEVYLQFARDYINRRTRDDYKIAAELLTSARDTFFLINNQAGWKTQITDIKAEFKRLPAFQDELRKAGL